jgi:DNA polymerase-1
MSGRVSLDAGRGGRQDFPVKRLFLLDGMALAYRAHFALARNPIRTSKGLNTSALHGFAVTLLSILEKEKPTHLGVAFDTKAPTARHVRYPAYKAHREEMPEELAAAIPQVKALCHAFRIPVLEMDGYEADDIIGTLVKRAEQAGFDSFMVTADKDFAQLLSGHVFLWRPGRKGDSHELIGVGDLPEFWGVAEPRQITDLLGLMGDSSDNIPGVPGIGPKTAQKLIARFGSVEDLLAKTSLLEGRQRELIEANADQALLSKELATICTAVPVEVSWEDLELSKRDDAELRRIFEEFEFRSLARRVLGEGAVAGQDAASAGQGSQEAAPAAAASFHTIRDTPHDYRILRTADERRDFLARIAEQASFCFDTETTSLDRFEAELLGIAFSWKEHEGWYLPWSPDLLNEVRPLFASAAVKTGHNLKFDLAVLERHGIRVEGPFFDTMLASSLVNPEGRHSMNHLSEALLGYAPIRLQDLLGQPAAAETPLQGDLFAAPATASKPGAPDMRAIPPDKLGEYAAEDADVTLRIAAVLRPGLAENGQDAVMERIEAPLIPVLVRMEAEGIAIDPSALREVGAELTQRIDELAASITRHAGVSFNIGSPKQLGEVLFDRLALGGKAKRTRTGQYRTDEQTLSMLEGSHPVIADILAWREATKLKSTYIEALPRHVVPQTGRVHTHFHQLVAATGRLASSDPNLQNIPVRSQAGRRIRKAFVPRGGKDGGFVILSCDYSQIELRIMAAMAGDATMAEAFRTGTDIHAVTAAKVFGVALDEVTTEMRRTAKMVNFGIIYGISAFGLSQRLGIPRTEAAAVIDAYFREYPAIRRFMEETVAEARRSGYAQTIAGRRRSFPDLHSANQTVRGNAERAAVNMPVQGSAADMIKLAMIQIDAMLREKPYRTKMLLQVHDELVFDLAADEEKELVPRILGIMRTALPLPGEVPVEVEYGTGPDWLAAH